MEADNEAHDHHDKKKKKHKKRKSRKKKQRLDAVGSEIPHNAMQPDKVNDNQTERGYRDIFDNNQIELMSSIEVNNHFK